MKRCRSRRHSPVVAVAILLVAPARALAHERWVKHDFQPFDHAYFHSMTGQVLRLSLAW